jgi:16S rRNA (cytidine1402-2'-O)-methyltransferase
MEQPKMVTKQIPNTPNPGTLYIVATPIGNLEDMTYRAVKVLMDVDLIAAEDTRHSKRLLDHYGIKSRLISYHEHNEIKKAPHLIQQIKDGINIALISDAGTPAISDPGYLLVSAAAKEKIPIIPIPGCSAAIAGLSISGLPTDSFIFYGFLPKKQQKQKTTLEEIKAQKATLIFYESPRRITKLIKNCISIFGDREACLAREITKFHEEYVRGTLSYIHEKLEQRDSVKGECALFIHGCNEVNEISQDELEHLIKDALSDGNIRTKDLAKKISKEYNLSTKKVYNMILELL